MTNTILANNIAQEELGYVLLAQLSPAGAERLTSLLDKLTSEMPGVLWPMPAEAMHITLCEIIQPKEYSQDKSALYGLHRREYENVPAEILRSVPKFKITFNTIEASLNAVIVRGEDQGVFNTIRAQLVRQLPLPKETKMPPDIVHSSIARYTAEANLAKVQEVAGRHEIYFEEQVTEFKLLKVLVQPLLKYEVVRTYPLS